MYVNTLKECHLFIRVNTHDCHIIPHLIWYSIITHSVHHSEHHSKTGNISTHLDDFQYNVKSNVSKGLKCCTKYHKLKAVVSALAGDRLSPENARRWPDVGLMLGQRSRRWPNIIPTPGQRLAFPGILNLFNFKWIETNEGEFRAQMVQIFSNHNNNWFLNNRQVTCFLITLHRSDTPHVKNQSAFTKVFYLRRFKGLAMVSRHFCQ